MRTDSYPEEIDLIATVTTPENVRFDYKLAGYARRLPAFILDFSLRVGVILGLFALLMCSGIMAGPSITTATAVAVMLIAYFLASWFYGTLFEAFYRGQTPGKRLLGIQVVMADGRPVNLIAALIRNLCRTADFMPMYLLTIDEFNNTKLPVPIFFTSICCMFITKRFQRLGDIAANTIVVVVEADYANRLTDLSDPVMDSIAAQLPADLVLQPSTVQAVSLYVDRRSRLNQTQREELSAILVKAIRSQFDLPLELSNDQIVCALHYREFYLRDDKMDWDDVGQTQPTARSFSQSPSSDPAMVPPALNLTE